MSALSHDWTGCSRKCAGWHTYVWGQCELAVDPGPAPLLVTETTTAGDGWQSTSIRAATAEELAAHPSVRALVDAAKASEPDADEEFAAPPMIGYPTASDLTMVARATGGGIRSTELLPEPDDDEDDDPRYVAARAYCLARFEYPVGFYADPQAREQHIEMDTRSTAAEGPFRAAVDAAVHHTEQRLDRSDDHRIAELTARLDTMTEVATSNRRHVEHLCEYQDQLTAQLDRALRVVEAARAFVTNYPWPSGPLSKRVQEYDRGTAASPPSAPLADEHPTAGGIPTAQPSTHN